jgi:putative endonuclease
MQTKLVGRWGEAVALDYLQRKKYTPVGAGYRTRFGEIDLIVKNKKYIIFVEVKTRKDACFAPPRAYVDERKQARIRTTAEIWLAEHETQLQPRFDVIEVYAPNGMNTRNPRIEHIKNAF